MLTRADYHPPTPHLERATGVTESSGNVPFTWPDGAFSAPPVVTVGIVGASAFRASSITANPATSTTVNSLAAAGVTLLGIGVLAVGVPAVGVVVHAHAVAAA